VDGCSAPNFAVPLRNAALGFARLSAPEGLPEKRQKACRTITSAMISHPLMVAGPGGFDTALMEAAGGKIVCKGGAEGYQGIGVMPGAIEPGSLALGITYKISDGDSRGLARSAIALEVLRQLHVLTDKELETLSEFGPMTPLYNGRKIHIGDGFPSFQLEFHQK
jgi:L-asparaginase II